MKRHLFALGFGLFGMGLALVLWHAWVDHQAWHVLLTAVVQQQRAAAPTPAVTP